MQRLMDVCDIGLRAHAAYIRIHLAPRGRTSVIPVYLLLSYLEVGA